MDADGHIYYHGRIILPPDDQPWAIAYDLAPLSGFGTPNSGVCDISGYGSPGFHHCVAVQVMLLALGDTDSTRRRSVTALAESRRQNWRPGLNSDSGMSSDPTFWLCTAWMQLRMSWGPVTSAAPTVWPPNRIFASSPQLKNIRSALEPTPKQ